MVHRATLLPPRRTRSMICLMFDSMASTGMPWKASFAPISRMVSSAAGAREAPSRARTSAVVSPLTPSLITVYGMPARCQYAWMSDGKERAGATP